MGQPDQRYFNRWTFGHFGGGGASRLCRRAIHGITARYIDHYRLVIQQHTWRCNSRLFNEKGVEPNKRHGFRSSAIDSGCARSEGDTDRSELPREQINRFTILMEDNE